MRKLTLSLTALAMMLPSTAMACHHGQSSSVDVSCEKGVRVYRAAPMAAPIAPIVVYKRNNNGFAKQRAALQSERLAAQAERIDALESQLNSANRPQRRRIYSAPVGAFGSGGFVNRRRGFKSRRNAGIKIRYNRRIRS
ncbi:MAG: hypothetical protein ABJN69_05730 [Hellea sp.]